MSGVDSFGGEGGELLVLNKPLFSRGPSSRTVGLERDGEFSRIEGVGDWGGDEYECRWSTYAVDIYSTKNMDRRDSRTMSPVHLEWSELKASGSRWTKAVERMTPVPKCLPRKKTTDGIRRYLTRFDSEGKDTARSETTKIPRLTPILVSTTSLKTSGAFPRESGAARGIMLIMAVGRVGA